MPAARWLGSVNAAWILEASTGPNSGGDLWGNTNYKIGETHLEFELWRSAAEYAEVTPEC